MSLESKEDPQELFEHRWSADYGSEFEQHHFVAPQPVLVLHSFGSRPQTFQSFGSKWMKEVSDDTRIVKLNIPGTHESAALINSNNPKLGALGKYARCNSLTITQQLDIGIRFFDLRVVARPIKQEGITPYLALYHGAIDQKSTYGCRSLFCRVPQNIVQPDIQLQIAQFLRRNPTECVIVKMKNECKKVGPKANGITNGKCASLIHIILTELLQDAHWGALYVLADKHVVQPTFNTMTVKDCRGKIVLITQKIDNVARIIQSDGKNHQTIYNMDKNDKEFGDYNQPWNNEGRGNRVKGFEKRLRQVKENLKELGAGAQSFIYQNGISANSAKQFQIKKEKDIVSIKLHGHPEVDMKRGRPLEWAIYTKPQAADSILAIAFEHTLGRRGDPVTWSNLDADIGVVTMDFADPTLSYLVILSNHGVFERVTAQQNREEFLWVLNQVLENNYYDYVDNEYIEEIGTNVYAHIGYSNYDYSYLLESDRSVDGAQYSFHPETLTLMIIEVIIIILSVCCCTLLCGGLIFVFNVFHKSR